MKQFLLFFLFLSCSPAEAQGPVSWQWAQSGTCTTSDNGSAITTDIFGNSYTTGYFYGSGLTFSTTTLSNMGNYDCFLVKHDMMGNFLWVRAIGGAYDEVGNAVCTDASGNVYVTGYFTSNTLAIGSSTLTNMGGTDVYIAKFDPSGNPVWARQFGDNMIEESYGISSDGSNVYITGQFQSNMITFGTGTLICNGGGDAYVIKYDANGNELWAKGFGDTGQEIANGISCRSGSDIFVTGSFKSPMITFNTYTLNNQGGSDYFVLRYDPNGNEIWADGAGGNFDDAGTSITESYTGEFYTTGYFKSSTLTLGSASYTNASATSADIFLIRYNSGGNQTLSKAYGGGLDDIPYGITYDPAGNIFIGGHIHSSTINFDTYTLTCSGVGDAFLVKLNGAGIVVWADNIGGLQDEGIGGMTSDPTYNILITGFYYSSSVNFGTNTLNNNGSADLFIAKLLNPPSGIAESNKQKAGILLYPNPATDGFYLANLEKNTVIHIYDMTGKEIQRYEIADAGRVYLPAQNLSRGIYLVSIVSETFNITQKINVIH